MKCNPLTATLIALGLTSAGDVLANSAIQENIIVTADRTAQAQFLSLSSTHVISQEEISALSPLNVTELLDKVAGISVVKQGDGGQSSSVFMRGTNNGHTLILVDGVRVGSATLGQTNFSSMSPEQIERIEVVKGPRAALWGSDAVGGVIQIFTKQLHSGEGSFSVGFGSNGLIKSGLAFGLGNEEHALSVTISGEKSDGFSAQTIEGGDYETDDDGYDRLALGMVGQSNLTETVSLHLASRWEQGGADYDPTFAGTANQEEFENYHLRLAGQYQVENLYGEVSLATSQDQGATFGNGVTKENSDAITTRRDQLSLLGNYKLTDSTSFTGGMDWYKEKVSTNTDKVSWVDGFQSWDQEQRLVKAYYIQGRYQDSDWLVEGALRRDDIERLAGQNTYSASVGYQITTDWLVSLNRSTGFKSASFNDLYWPGAGNPDLKPENITSNEILVRNKFALGQFELSVFQSDIENLIDWAPNQLGVWQPSNINQAEINGVELSFNVKHQDFDHQVAMAYLDAKDTQKNLELARRPNFTANYTLGYQWQAFDFNTSISYRGDSEDATSEYSKPLESYWLTDVSVGYQVTDKLKLVAKVNNLFNQRYETAKYYVADGINYVINIGYTF